MTVFADLDVSTLAEMPAGIKDITTHAVSLADHPHWMDRILQLIDRAAAAGKGTFVVFPRIEPSEIDDPESGEPTGQMRQGIEEYLESLENSPQLASRRFGLLHGRMPTAEKDRVMHAFSTGEIDILVSTTVIEVGVDVPRAVMMVIAEADRFGIAQLHQLRGRVGRDGSPAMCFLLTEFSEADESFERLRTVAATSTGSRSPSTISTSAARAMCSGPRSGAGRRCGISPCSATRRSSPRRRPKPNRSSPPTSSSRTLRNCGSSSRGCCLPTPRTSLRQTERQTVVRDRAGWVMRAERRSLDDAGRRTRAEGLSRRAT